MYLIERMILPLWMLEAKAIRLRRPKQIGQNRHSLGKPSAVRIDTGILRPFHMAKTQVTGPQLRAARMFVGWTIRTLAKKANVYENTVIFIEKGRHRAKDDTLEALRTGLENKTLENSKA
jgi:DNA-binding XRE family transcriptional regulator